MIIKNKYSMFLTGLFLVFSGLFLHAGEYSFSGYLPKVVKAPGSVMVKIDTAVRQRKLYIHYRTEGLEDYQVRMMKRDKNGALYYRLPTGNLYGKTIEYFISASDMPVPGSLLPVFTITGFTDKGSPEIYFLGAEGGSEGKKKNSKFKFPIDIAPSVSAVFRVHDKTESPGKSFDANGNIGLSRTISGKKSEFGFGSNISYTHNVGEGDGRFNLTSMMVRFKTGKHSFSAGDLSVNISEFTASSLARRGLSYKMQGKRLYLASFLTNAQQKSGFSGFGIPPSYAHIFGTEAGFRIGKTANVRGMFISGNDNLDSKTVVNAQEEVRKGSVYSIQGDWKLFKKKLELRGEFAHSNFGRGTGGAGVEKKSDNAWRVEANFRHGIVSAHTDYKKIGRHFGSIGNLFLNNDRQGLNTNVGLTIKTFSAGLNYTDQKTNLNNDVQPRLHSKNISSNFNWIIAKRFRVGGGFSLNNLDYDESSGLQTGSKDMNTIRYHAVLGYISGPNGITFNLGKTEAKTFSSNIDGSVNILLKFGKVLQLTPTFSYQSTKNFADDSTSRIYNAYLNGVVTFIPGYFSLNINASGTKNVNPNGDTTSISVGGNLNFQMAELFKQKVKPTLSLRSSYQGFKNNKTSDRTDNVTVYLQLDLSF